MRMAVSDPLEMGFCENQGPFWGPVCYKACGLGLDLDWRPFFMSTPKYLSELHK